MGSSEVDPQQPDWSRLPNNPRGFFGLPANFDRKLLKRKYNQFIRIYKPERAPAEFQKIRAAYELLDGQLRYGTAGTAGTTESSNSSFDWNTGANANTPSKPLELEPLDSIDPPDRTAKGNRPKRSESMPLEEIATPVYDRLESETAAEIFKEFEKAKGKNPYDYFTMALLADVASDDPLMFFKLVLTGVSRHPNERGLYNLLYEYLQQEQEPKYLARILQAVSKVVTDQRFYFLTEKLWDQLLREAKFNDWKSLLESCESNLKDYRVDGQLAFYLHVFPAAMWKADDAWIDKIWRFFADHSSEIPNSLDLDYEVSYQLLQYRKSFGNHELYRSPEIHAAIKDYFLLGGQAGDEAVISLQSHLATNAAGLLAQFGPDIEYDNHQIIVWDYVNDEVCQRNDLGSRIHPRALRAKIYDLMDDLNRSEYANFGTWDELMYRVIHWGPYLVAIFLPIILVGGWFTLFYPNPRAATETDKFLAKILPVTMIAGMAAAIWFVKQWIKPEQRYQDYITNKMRRRYYSHWRGRFVQLFESTQILHGELSEALVEVVQNHSDRLGFATWLCHFLPADAGLYLYASASRYLR